MIQKKKQCEMVIEKNYAAILRYCKWRMDGNEDAAAECTQEVFLLFLEKMNELDLNLNISGWLYACADRLTKKYRHILKIRNQRECPCSEDLGLFTEPFNNEPSGPLDALDEEEYELIRNYYVSDSEERGRLAKELGITVNLLYQRIHAIKKKIHF